MTVRELLQRIDSTELAEWIAYYSLEPFGQERDSLNSAIIAATIANANRASKSKTYKPSDFMPDFEHKEQSAEDMKAILDNML